MWKKKRGSIPRSNFRRFIKKFTVIKIRKQYFPFRDNLDLDQSRYSQFWKKNIFYSLKVRFDFSNLIQTYVFEGHLNLARSIV